MSKKTTTLLKAGLLLSLLPLISYGNEEISLGADNWCPYTCSEESQLPGLGVELARDIFKSNNITLSYQIHDWQKALKLGRQGKLDGVIGPYASGAKGFIFPKQHFAYSQACFISLKKNDWIYQGASSLNTQRLGIIQSYSYGRFIDKYIQTPSNRDKIITVGGNNALETLIDMLNAETIDVLSDDIEVFRKKIKNSKNLIRYNISGCLPRTRIYIAFSNADPQKADRLVKILDEGLTKLIKSGDIEKYYKKYGLQR